VEVLVTRTAHAIVEQGEEAQESQDDYIKINELPMKEEVSCLLPLPWKRRSPIQRMRREGDTRLSPGVTQGWGSREHL